MFRAFAILILIAVHSSNGWAFSSFGVLRLCLVLFFFSTSFVFSEEIFEDPRELKVSAGLWAEGHNEFDPTVDNILNRIRLGRDVEYLCDLLVRFKPLSPKRETQVLDLILEAVKNPENSIRTDRLVSLFSRVPISHPDTIEKLRLVMNQSLPFETKRLVASILMKLEFSSQETKEETFSALRQVALNPDAHAETRILAALHLIEMGRFIEDAERVLAGYLRRPKSAHLIFLNASFEESVGERVSDRLYDKMSAALELFDGAEREHESWRLKKIQTARAKWEVDCSAGLIELGLIQIPRGGR